MTPATLDRPRSPIPTWAPGASLTPALHPLRPRARPFEPRRSQIRRQVVIISGAASSLYDLGRQRFGSASVSWTADTIKVGLVTTAYSPNLTTNEFLSDVGANLVGTDQTLTSKTNTAGVMNAGTATWSGGAAPPSSGTQIAYIVIYKFVTNAGDSPLIGLIDTATNLPLTPNGGSVSVAWSTGANKIFKL